MSLSDAIAIIVAFFALFGGIWGIIKGLLARDRKNADDQTLEAKQQNKDAQDAIWESLDRLRSDMTGIQIEQGVLRERMHALPSGDFIHERLEAIEGRLEKKLEAVVTRMESTFKLAAEKFRCPNAAERS